jgi:hypothetical protein
MDFFTARNHPESELQAARQWYAEAIATGA